MLNSISSGCTRDVSEKGYTAASRRTGTEALARPRRRCGGPLPRTAARTIGLGTYSSVVRWLPPPTFSTHLLPSERGPFSVWVGCVRGVCASREASSLSRVFHSRLRLPRCVSTGPVVVRLAEMAIERERVSQPMFHSSSITLRARSNEAEREVAPPPLPPSWTSTARISTQLRPAQRS